MAEGSVRSYNFVVQLDNFWTAGRYFHIRLYSINVCVKVYLILVFSFCRLNICCLILSLAQTQNFKFTSFFVGQTMRVELSQNLELIVGPGDPISGNGTSNSVFYKWDVQVF